MISQKSLTYSKIMQIFNNYRFLVKYTDNEFCSLKQAIVHMKVLNLCIVCNFAFSSNFNNYDTFAKLRYFPSAFCTSTFLIMCMYFVW
jgi:hypothetical protein